MPARERAHRSGFPPFVLVAPVGGGAITRPACEAGLRCDKSRRGRRWPRLERALSSRAIRGGGARGRSRRQNRL